MKINRSNSTNADFEIGERHIIDVFVSNIKMVNIDDVTETIKNIIMGQPNYSAKEFLSVFNAVIEKLKDE